MPPSGAQTQRVLTRILFDFFLERGIMNRISERTEQKQRLTVRFGTFLAPFLALAAISCPSAPLLAESGKKMIELGWDIPTTAYLRDHAAEMEAQSPFDGVIYDLSATDADGVVCSSQSLWSAKRWNPADFQSCIDDLNACTFTKFKSNFVRVNFHPADVRWDDDAAWGAIFDKIRICVHVVHATGGAGLSLDFESYGAALFRWNPDEIGTFDEAKQLARKRGAELIQTAAEEYSDQTILCLWMNSVNLGAGRRSDPDAVLKTAHYGLLPAFIDGMLDVLPPEMTLVDGCENGYYIEGNDYAHTALDMILVNGPAARLVSPPNRAKYRAQVQAGFGFYLDMYSNPEGNRYYRGPLEGGTRRDRLEKNLAAAWNAADEYVWVYGEKHRWWNLPENSVETLYWDDAIAGLSHIIEKIKDPAAAARQRYEELRAEGNAVNLLKNGDFSRSAETTPAETTPPETTESNASNEAALPDGWRFWQDENHATGRCFLRDESAVLENVTFGCLHQAVDVKPGEEYFVAAKVRYSSRTAPSVRIRWQTAAGDWTEVKKDVITGPEDNAPNEANEPNVQAVTLRASARVPEGVGKIVVLLGAANQKDENDRCAFDDVELVRLF